MAGPGQWANIRHRKAAQDAKRGIVFTKLIHKLVVPRRAGGPIAQVNPRLRAAADKALGANMKRDTIDSAIARGAGTNDADNMEELTYEGYAPGGVAILVEVMTDNRNRTVGDVRHAFTKRGGNLGTDGSVAYLFSRSGLNAFAPGVDEDVLLEVGLESGADDVIVAEDGSVDVLTPWESLTEVKDALLAAGLEPLDAEVTMLPSTEVELDIDAATSVMGLIDMLEDLDDVQNVYSNANISETVLSAL